MAVNHFLTLLALPVLLPILFAVLFCGVYLVLLLVNAGFALVSGYRRTPLRLLVPSRVMVTIALVLATLLCVWFLIGIDGRYT